MKNFPTYSVKTTIFLVLLSLMCYGEVFSFQSTFIPADQSQLWIEGRSNVNEFECRANEYTGAATLPEFEGPASIINRFSDQLSIQIDIRVDSFECGKRKMNSDLREALKAEIFPEITFLFDEAELLSEPQSINDTFEIEVYGTLTVAGITKQISFITNAYFLNEEQVRATGQTLIRMTDFNVEPPTALMGLIKAAEELTVHFDLIASEVN